MDPFFVLPVRRAFWQGARSAFYFAQMKRFSLVGLAALAVVLGEGGCSHLPFLGQRHQNKKVETQSRHVAAATETEFKGRWVDKRTGELVAQGESQDGARSQAEREFFQKFPAVTIAPVQPPP